MNEWMNLKRYYSTSNTSVLQAACPFCFHEHFITISPLPGMITRVGDLLNHAIHWLRCRAKKTQPHGFWLCSGVQALRHADNSVWEPCLGSKLYSALSTSPTCCQLSTGKEWILPIFLSWTSPLILLCLETGCLNSVSNRTGPCFNKIPVCSVFLNTWSLYSLYCGGLIRERQWA